MSDLISRQDVLDILAYWDDWENMVRDLPSVNPDIVYCADCKYKDDGIDENGIPFLKCLHGRSYGGTRINDYCSWGERKEDGSDRETGGD